MLGRHHPLALRTRYCDYCMHFDYYTCLEQKDDEIQYPQAHRPTSTAGCRPDFPWRKPHPQAGTIKTTRPVLFRRHATHPWKRNRIRERSYLFKTKLGSSLLAKKYIHAMDMTSTRKQGSIHGIKPYLLNRTVRLQRVDFPCHACHPRRLLAKNVLNIVTAAQGLDWVE